jgi:hypothetical protein
MILEYFGTTEEQDVWSTNEKLAVIVYYEFVLFRILLTKVLNIVGFAVLMAVSTKVTEVGCLLS